MSSLRKTLFSSIGAKTLMAVTGLLLVGFVIGHMVGNLQVFAGRDQLNAYAAKLQSLGPLLWVVRLGLLAIFVTHFASAFRIWRQNHAARPEKYVKHSQQVTSFAARTMWWSGVIVLAFVIYHLLHLTIGVTHADHYALHETLADGTERHDVYAMVILGFRQAPVAIGYLVAQILLAVHISHGASSAFQTLGVRHARLQFLKKGFGPAVAIFIAIGNCAIPLTILLGLVGEGVK